MKKGWFWICPITWEPETQTLGPRFKLWPLFNLMMFLHHSMIFLAALIGYEIEEGYPLKIKND